MKNYILSALFAALITIGTYIKIPTPLLPLTLQTLFVVLSGLVLGHKFGPASVLVYIGAGLAGLPVFTGSVFNPTFGYIIGFVFGSFIAGYIAESFKPCLITWTLGALAGMAVIYAVGIPYYYIVYKYYLGNELGAKALLLYFVLMPLPGDCVKSLAAGLIAQRLSKIFPDEFTWNR
ncbi:MAG: biotin transporter BioY [Synergistaceae bacterium]|nr:biotin transporter BioY [Synergistaceae bacterium]